MVAAAVPAVLAPRRSDAGSVRLGERDVCGLVLVGDMYGAPYDLLATALGARPERLRGIVARWRRAGFAATGRLGPGPAWCWLTRTGLAVTGQLYAPTRPALGRLAHIRAVLAIRLSLEPSAAFRDGRGVVAVGTAYPRRERVILFSAVATVVVAAAPVSLVAGVAVVGAWLRGWPPARLWRAAAWSLPMPAVYVAGRALHAGSWRARDRWRPGGGYGWGV